MGRTRSRSGTGTPLSLENARQGYRTLRSALIASTVAMCLLVVFVAVVVPGWAGLVGGLALLQVVAVPFLLRYLKRNVVMRAARVDHDRDDASSEGAAR